MKRAYFILALALMFMPFSVFGLGTLKDSYSSNIDDGEVVYGTRFLLMEFKAGSDYTLDSIKLYLKTSGTPEGSRVGIYNCINEVPDGSELGGVDQDLSGLLSGTYNWITYSGFNVSITSLNSYCIVLSAPDSISQDVIWGSDYTAHAYTDGSLNISTNSGGSWNGPYQSDMYFETYDNGGEQQGGESTTASTTVFITDPSDYTQIWFFSIILFSLGFIIGLRA